MGREPSTRRQQLRPGGSGAPEPRPSVATRAIEFVTDGDVVGLGTGRAATAFVEALGSAVKAGLRIRAIPTSQVTADLAEQLGIPLARLDEVGQIDVTFDGADEVDPRLDLIKGYGGAMVREKIVAASSRRLIILVGAEKLVPVGTKFSFAWKVKGGTATVSDVKGDSLKTHLEGDFSEKK